MSILIVDDSQDDLSLLEHILKEADYNDLLLAKSAAEAFHLLNMNDPPNDNEHVDLILMDIIMPEIDGIKACRTIKEHSHLQGIPVIMVTAVTETKELQLAFAAGAVDYVTKPFNKIELLARVRSALKLKYEMDARKAHEKELIELTRQLEAANKMLERLSYMDGLTGIPNRRYFDEFIGQEWKRAMRDATPVSLILADIDHFKAFNDTYGHQAGDDCLRQIAKAFNSAVRRPGDIAARYGGEEFIVVLSGTDMAGAVSVAETIRLRVVELGIPHANSGVTDRVSMSLGVATAIPGRNTSPTALIGNADKALYKAKDEGRNRIAVKQ